MPVCSSFYGNPAGNFFYGVGTEVFLAFQTISGDTIGWSGYGDIRRRTYILCLLQPLQKFTSQGFIFCSFGLPHLRKNRIQNFC